MTQLQLLLILLLGLVSCNPVKETDVPEDAPVLIISRNVYQDQLQGFWLGQCIANWTGLITEMDKIGNHGEIKTGDFYTRDNWGGPDLPSIWGQGLPSDISPTIDFVLLGEDSIWGADDDTDIEYMYQYLMLHNKQLILTPEQIREGWLTHIKSEEENYLWVSNQKAFDLMMQGYLPPMTSSPDLNEHTEMIDAQLTTEIFGLFAPGRPDIALKLAELPILTSARGKAKEIAEFYVTMYSMASYPTEAFSSRERVLWMADFARQNLTDTLYPAKMYDFVLEMYESGKTWEETRDSVYQRYQVNQMDGYTITSEELYCNGCFAAGINFAASLISLFYGEGDFKETVKIGVLTGWDSDNPTATWGGMLGFMMGKKQIEKIFDQKFSTQFNIHRTRQNFPNDGIDNFQAMATSGVDLVDQSVASLMGGKVDEENDRWHIPLDPQGIK